MNGALEHPWLGSIDLHTLETRRLLPPYVPSLKDEGDASNFYAIWSAPRARAAACPCPRRRRPHPSPRKMADAGTRQSRWRIGSATVAPRLRAARSTARTR